MRVLLIILDGAADRPDAKLGMKTPLQAARLPNLRRLALSSLMGMMYPVGKGIAPESDEAVFSMLGYSLKDYTGRGPMEAYGAGMKVYDSTLALRANFATIRSNRTILDRRAGRKITKKEAKSLEMAINSIKLHDGTKFLFRSTIGHRGAVAFYSSAKLSPNISNIDTDYIRKGNVSVAVPAKAGQKLPFSVPLDKSSAAARTAGMVNEFTRKVIAVLCNAPTNKIRRRKGLPEANALLLRNAGIGLPHVKPIGKKFGIRSAFITEMPVETGIARVVGMKEIAAKSEAGNRAEKYASLAETANAQIRNYDLIYVHIKGPDEPGHDGKPLLKKRVLEEIDKGFFANLKCSSAAVCITSDHSTPCALKAHSSDPVPVMIHYNGIRNPDTMGFDERIGRNGSLGVFNGRRLMEKLLSIAKNGAKA